MIFFHHYTLTPVWQQQVVDFFGATLIDNKQLILPEPIGYGGSYFLELMPGFSVLLMDAVFNTEVILTRQGTKDEFCIIYYDLSDEISNHIINKKQYKVGYQAKLGMGIIDCSLESTYVPQVGERIYSLRLFISKKLLQQEDFNPWRDGKAGTLFHYSHIDSRSKVVLHRLKHRAFNEPAYDLLLRGVSFTLLTFLLESAGKVISTHVKLSEKDIAGVMRTERYMLDRLTEDFPGITTLSTMAGMSASKYKQLFKRVFGDSPNRFFLNEKLLLGQHLLANGDFGSVSEVAYELGYSKPGYFAAAYRKKFKQLPREVLKK